ncbi:ABC transporter permease [Bordetella sp. FB-8]|uniref:ABC transporter permease n=1 Tax=Bordetella sp. FB-8 TaxID=1159870 RepID=UPI0003787B9B|nr:ABC transporter permease [Bordetella sp. FB-8]
MPFKPVLLWTDAALFLMLACVLLYAVRVARSATLRATWSQVAHSAPAMCSAIVLLVLVAAGLLDSLHYQPRLPPASAAPAHAGAVYSPAVRSALDGLFDATVLTHPEKTYSAPLAWRQFTKETMLMHGQPVRDFPRLKYGGAYLADPATQWRPDVFMRLGWGMLGGVAAALVAGALLGAALSSRHGGWRRALGAVGRNRTQLPWRAMLCTVAALCLLIGAVAGLASGYHVLGTDRTGNDVLWQCIKSVRTALVIGSLTTAAMLPPAIFFGIAAGYFKGGIDIAIQYLYTTITSIPGVLLVAACSLMMQVYIDRHAEFFDTSAARADLRLFLLCMILGLTGWDGLCRLLRAETLKLRELDYVQAARAFGVSNWRIMRRHLLPNVMHLILITVVLQFSSLVLYEAVLSYLGIGVDPSMNSFGSMIDRSRYEMSRDPMVWWGLLSAFVFMLTLVLAANLFADAVRDALDPRLRRRRTGRAVADTGASP